MSQPLVNFSKGLCSICGFEQVLGEDLKEQGCSGNHAMKWAACPLCVGCAAQGFKASSVRKTRIQSKRIVRGQKLARAVQALRPAAVHKGASEASSNYSE
jgi:ribosomal protein L37E